MTRSSTTIRTGSAASAAALLVLSLATPILTPTAALAAPGDGAVNVRVVQETNGNGLVDEAYVELPLTDVTVTLTDAAGTSLTATTGPDGTVTFNPTTLVGGQYRVEVQNPDPDFYEPGFAANGQSPQADPITPADLKDEDNNKLSTTVEFVDVADGEPAYVNTSFWFPGHYCQLNAPVVTACQPWDAVPQPVAPPDEQTLISLRYQFTDPEVKLAEKQDTGAVYGIAYDREGQRLFSAAYAKRGAEYGPAGQGGLYVTNLDSADYPVTGTTEVYDTVPNAGTSVHDMDTDADYGFFDVPGTESLGDIDITFDNQYLFGVNMFDKTVFVYDLDTDTRVGTYPIPNPCTVGTDWRPMATGSSLTTSYVGGVCSAESSRVRTDLSAHVYTFDPAAGTFGAAPVLSDPLTFGRGLANAGFVCNGSLIDDATTGAWFAWVDSYPNTANEQRDFGCVSGQVAYPTPILGDIVEEINGDLVLSFRDRFADQNGWYTLIPDANGNMGLNGGVTAGGDILRGCKLADGTFVLDPNLTGADVLAPGAVCTDNNADLTLNNGGQARTYREFYVGEWRTGFHNEAFYSGIALSYAEDTMIGAALDPSGAIYTQGIAGVQRDGSLKSPPYGQIVGTPSADFGKGQGMADLEVLCDEAPIQIGSRLWIDTDNDGVQDPGELPLAGVTVNLYNSAGDLIGTTVTSENGEYFFDDSNVEAGVAQDTAYTVRLDNPEDYEADGPLFGYTPTTPNAGDDDLDSDGIVAGDGFIEASLRTGGAGVNDHSWDFGFVLPSVSVGDFVWVDTNRDGLQDPGEPGIPGVVLVLTGPDGEPVLDINGNEVGPVTTDANGEYSFDLLPLLAEGESYTVSIDQAASAPVLAPYLPTIAGAGDDPALDSSTDSAESGDLTEAGARDDTLDFGFVLPSVSVGDYVWVDTDRDGLQDEGEPGIEGVVLVLTGPDGNPVTDVYGNPVGPVTTDENGGYSFDNLPVLGEGESYTVSIDQEASATALAPYTPTVAGDGSNPLDSSTWTATSGDLTEDGDRDPTLDFGFVPGAVSVGDYVWVDSDRDGVQDAGEPGIPGVVLVLTGPDGEPVTDIFGEPVGPVTTDANGLYSFDDLPTLPAGQSYTVSIDRTASATALAPYVPTLPGVGDPAADSATWTATSGDLTADGDRDPTLDFGFVTPSVSVGDYVWIDENRDGLQTPGEPGIPGVVLVLTGPDGNPVTDVFGNPVGPLTTDANGYYSFDNLPALAPGQSYTVTVDRTASATALAPFIPTAAGDGSSPLDSSTWTATSGDLTENGDREPTLDFGFVRPSVSVGDFVWVDTDRDGVQDPGEPGIPGVVLVLTGPDGQPVTDVFGNPVGPVTTDANGLYSFDNLPALPAGQSYTVAIDRTASATALAPYLPTRTGAGDAATDSSTWSATSGDLTTDGARDATLDFGFVRPAVSVGDSVWVDTDRDGVQDPGEPGIPGVVLVLTGPDGQPVTDVFGNPVGPVTTDANGHYLFANLPALPAGQSYTVSIDREASRVALAPYFPTTDAYDSWTWSAKSGDLTQDGASDLTLDFGFVPAHGLAHTGVAVPQFLIAAGLLLLLGVGFQLGSRRLRRRADLI